MHPDAGYCTWEARSRGGMTPFTYEWSGILQGRERRIRGRVREPGYLAVTLKDVIGREVRDSVYVEVGGGVVRCGYSPPPPGGDTLDTPQ